MNIDKNGCIHRKVKRELWCEIPYVKYGKNNENELYIYQETCLSCHQEVLQIPSLKEGKIFYIEEVTRQGIEVVQKKRSKLLGRVFNYSAAIIK